MCDASKMSKRISTSRGDGARPVAASSRAAMTGRDSPVHVIAPIAGTRMLSEGTSMPEEIIDGLKVEHIVSLVLYLCHEDCESNGAVFECGGGVYQKVQIARAPGWTADLSRGDPTVEDIAELTKSGPDSWSISELTQAIVIMAHHGWKKSSTFSAVAPRRRASSGCRGKGRPGQ